MADTLNGRRKRGKKEPLPKDFDAKTAELEKELARLRGIVSSAGSLLLVDDSVIERQKVIRARLANRQKTKERFLPEKIKSRLKRSRAEEERHRRRG